MTETLEYDVGEYEWPSEPTDDWDQRCDGCQRFRPVKYIAGRWLCRQCTRERGLEAPDAR